MSEAPQPDAPARRDPLVDVVIAVHDVRRPIERAVRSVLADPGDVRVTVVCHGLQADDVSQRLDDMAEDRLRLVEFWDGVKSAAGPFNHGLSLATADYVSFMGSDDFLEPGAMRRWMDYVEAEKPDVALARLRYQDGNLLSNPLARVGRRRRLHPVKDRIFYRTAPLGLLRRDTVERLGLRMTEGFRTGEDMSFSVRLWTSGARIDYLRSLPAYVIGSDAAARVTTAPMSAEDFFRPVNALLADSRTQALDPATRRSLAIKLARIHVLGYVLQRTSLEDWPDGDLQHVVETLAGILRLSPTVVEPFSRADRDVVDALLEQPATREGVVAAALAHSRAGRIRTVLPRRLPRILDRESVAVRYLLYSVAR